MKQSAESAHLFLDNRYCWEGKGKVKSSYKVNFRELLGDMYDKYSKFRIVHNCYGSFSGDWTNVPGYSTIGTLRMTGLNWAHSSYGTIQFVDSTAGAYKEGVVMYGNNAEAVFPNMFILADNGVTSLNYFNNAGLCFYRPTEDYTTITTFIRDIRANAPNSSIPENQFYNMSMSFTIYGLYD